jgi:hypothetical protein
MAGILVTLTYTVAILTLVFGLVYLLVNTVEMFKKHAGASIELYNDIRLGFFSSLVLLFIAWFLGHGGNFAEEITYLSNTLRNLGLIWFSYACLSALGLLANFILTDDKSGKEYTNARTNLMNIIKTIGAWSIVIIALSLLFS